MKPILTFLCFLLLVCIGFAKDKHPNVITLLVDDLGYRDIGCYGGPVKPPVPSVGITSVMATAVKSSTMPPRTPTSGRTSPMTRPTP